MEKCAVVIPDRIAAVITITIAVLLCSQSISIKKFNWLNAHFAQFIGDLFLITYKDGNILATSLNFKILFFLLNLYTGFEFWANF